MLTLKQTLEEQRNLKRLCATRPNPSRDRFAPNGHYGVSDVYKTYAGLPLSHNLNGIVPHGVALDPNWLWHEEVIARVSHVYCYPEMRARVYKTLTKKKVILTASPFIYVADMLKGDTKPRRRGTLMLPMHSTDHVRAHQNYNMLAAKLSSLPAYYHPICVCLYWKDYLLGAARPFQARGIPVVSAGHLYDRQFMYRLYHLFSQFQYVTSNGLGSHLFYAVKAGCACFHTNIAFQQQASQAVLERDCSFKGGSAFSYQHQLKSLFRRGVAAPLTEQVKMADYYLGAKYFKSREELKDDLLAA